MLNVAAIEKCALAEFGKGVTCVVFLQGCDIRCSYCQNAGLIPRYSEKVMEMTTAELSEQIPWAEIDALSISGGEPLHSAVTSQAGSHLMALLMEARMVKHKKTNVDTNGMFYDDKVILLENIGPYLTTISVDIKYMSPDYIHGMARALKRADVFRKARFRMVMYAGRFPKRECIDSGLATIARAGIKEIRGVRNHEACEMMTDGECAVAVEYFKKHGIALVI